MSHKASPVAQWQALSSLYEQACDLDPDARRTMLAALAARDPALHDGLRRMLAARDEADAGGFLDSMPRLAVPSRGAVPPLSREGARVGPYRLVRKLGAGGMAEVWLGSRDDGSFRRQVAVKLPYARVAPGTDVATLARRFARERDILASLRHPHIAGLIDAGVSDAGDAWLALEYVEGEPIHRWCDTRRAPIRERVKLFRQVLLAVQHAHANLVIHRDLKPANILVTAGGEVRLLDFGIAKLLEADSSAADETELTRLGGAPLTPRYASPEQLTGATLTTACDVYALGAVFYELIAGLSPYETKVDTVAAIERAIVESEPRAPSRRLLTEEIAAARGTGVKPLRRLLAPELDAIALRCLGKTPAQRYSSVDALIADVDRWLGGEAVLARAPGPWTRAMKFALRNKVGVGFGFAAVVALVATAAIAVYNGLEARQESARAGAARDFMLELFKRADDEKARGANLTARELLDAGRRDVITRLEGQPALQAELLQGIATIQFEMGEHSLAEGTYADWARIQQAAGNPRGAAMAYAEQAINAIWMSDPKRAEELLRKAEAQVGRPGPDDELEARLTLVDGWVATSAGQAQRGLGLFEKSRKLAAATFGEQDIRVFEAIRGLVYAERMLGNFDRAIALQDQAIAGSRAQPKIPRRSVAWAEALRIDLLYVAGRFERVASLSPAASSDCDERFGADSDVCRRLFLKHVQGQIRVGSMSTAIAARHRIDSLAADESSPFLSIESSLVAFRLALAQGEDVSALAAKLRRFGESGDEVKMNPSFKATALAVLAEAQLRAGDPEQALPMLDRALVLLGGPVVAKPTAHLAFVKSLKGIALMKRGDTAGALEWLRSGQGDFASSLGAAHPLTVQCNLNIATALRLRGDHDAAAVQWDAADPALAASFGRGSATYARIQRARDAWRRGETASASAADFFV